MDAAAQKHLSSGGKVLLFPRHDELKHCVKGAFQTDFWCWPMFAKARHPARDSNRHRAHRASSVIRAHPALAEFPTEFHSNWQWWRLVKNARPIILDETPADYRPIIHVIDNFARNHKLGLLFETRVGQGKLLVCASDLPALQDYPEARQLMHSLLRYVGSQAFDPKTKLDENLLEETASRGCPMNRRDFLKIAGAVGRGDRGVCRPVRQPRPTPRTFSNRTTRRFSHWRSAFRQVHPGETPAAGEPLQHTWVQPGGPYYVGQWIWDTMFVVDLLSILPGKKQVIRDIFQNYWDFQDRWNQQMPAYAHDMVTVAIKTAPQKVRQFSQSPDPGLGRGTSLSAQRRQGTAQAMPRRLERFHDWFWRERDVTATG